jgi:leader peptidase (prepilin peptidase)/N-methyltransferase
MMNTSWVLVLVVGLLGLIFGSFATVLTKRVPQNISIIAPNSRCESCGALIPRRYLIPLMSFLVLRGRSKCCDTQLSWQYPLIELTTAALFLISYGAVGASLEILPLLILAILTMPLVLTDIKVQRLPNALTYSGILAGIASAIIISIAQGSTRPFIYSLLLTFISGLAFLMLNLLSRGGMGMGDVKLAAMLGTLLSPFGWSTLGTGFIFAFFLGATIGLLLLASKKATRKTLIPFGPYMLLGAWLAIGIGEQGCQQIINLWSLKG